MLRRFLTDSEEALLQAEQRALISLRAPLAMLEASADDLTVLDKALLQLDELFLLVVVGEFNAGKSAFINALLGAKILEEGVTPTTTEVQILKYGDGHHEGRLDSDVVVLTAPVEWLRDINIVDTPGTNAVIQRHQEITEEFVPRADLVLFLTSADRPFSESERTFLRQVRDWGKKVVIVVNKIDILETPEEVDRVIQFVDENARQLLRRRPTVFAISGRQARQAKETYDADLRMRLWTASRFEPLESYILETLDERERLRLKLANPLGVALRLTEKYLEIAQNRGILLRDDITTVETIETQLTAHEADMRRDFKYHLSHVDNVLYAMADRGSRFFEETIRLSRVFDLINAERVRGMFERQVVAETAAEVEIHTRELIDWLVDADFRQWQDVTEFVNKRIAHHEDHLVGQVGGKFRSSRQSLLESVGRTAREVVAEYDKATEAKQLAESVKMAVAQTAIFEVSAIGLGALLVKLLATVVADVTGVLAASAVAALGFYVIPNRRRRAKNDLQTKISDLRDRLGGAMTKQFERELTESVSRIREAMRPYTRFVEAQRASLADTEAVLRETRQTLHDLSERVGQLEQPAAEDAVYGF